MHRGERTPPDQLREKVSGGDGTCRCPKTFALSNNREPLEGFELQEVTCSNSNAFKRTPCCMDMMLQEARVKATVEAVRRLLEYSRRGKVAMCLDLFGRMEVVRSSHGLDIFRRQYCDNLWVK